MSLRFCAPPCRDGGGYSCQERDFSSRRALEFNVTYPSYEGKRIAGRRGFSGVEWLSKKETCRERENASAVPRSRFGGGGRSTGFYPVEREAEACGFQV
ncbi:hypothetical protein CXU21_10495 [Akkermansia muciniphila]|nr:hypothetical protein CXU21_10495 [Akkermansia muciniphila]